MDEHTRFLDRLFLSPPSEFEANFGELIAYCKSIKRDAPWLMLDRLSLDSEADEFSRWIRGCLFSERVPGSVKAFYLGLSEDGRSVRLDGASDFASDDAQCEWIFSSVYRPDKAWNDSRALHFFADISEESDGGVPILLYLLGLGYIGLMIRKHAPIGLWIVSAVEMPVAVGFDDGDAYVVHKPGVSPTYQN